MTSFFARLSPLWLVIGLVVVSAWGQQAAAETIPIWEDVIDVKIAVGQRNFPRAIEYAQAALKKDPKNWELYEYVAYLFLLQKNTPQANATIKLAETREIPASYLIGPQSLSFLLEDKKLTLERYASGLSKGSINTLVAQAALAVQAYQEESWEDWKRIVKGMEDGWSDFVITQLFSATRHLRDKNYKEALPALIAITESPEKRDLKREVVHLLLGLDLLLYQEVMPLEESFAAIRKGEDDATMTETQRLCLAFAQFYLGRFRQAQEVFQQVLAENPDSLPALVQGGVFHLMNQDFATAEKQFKHYLKLKPGVLRTRKLLAAVQGLAGDVNIALAMFSQLSNEDPKDAEAWTNLGVFRLAKDDEQGAEEAYLKAIEVDPEHADAFRNLGTLRVRQGRSADARKRFEQAAQANPLDVEASRYLGLLLYDMGQVLDARRWLLRADTLSPNNPSIQLSLGLCYLADENYGDAVTVLEAALKSVPKLPAARLSVAEAYYKMKNYAKARMHLEELQKMVPDLEEATALMEKVKAEESKYGGDQGMKVVYTVFTSEGRAKEVLAKVKTAGELSDKSTGSRVLEVEIFPGEFLPEIEAVAGKLAKGGISDVIETKRGYFIVQRK